jgi:hypothetical protein
LGAKLVVGGSLKLVVTTNWDDLIEKAVNAPVALPAPVPGNPYIAKQIPENPKPVVHLHGVLDAGSGGWPATEPLVFSRSDFLEFTRPATAEPRWQDELVSLCFRESTCLFVGTSMSDLNYQRWIYERSTRSYATRGRPVEQIAARPGPQCVILFHAGRFEGPHGDELKQAVANRWAEWRARTMFLETQEIVTLIDGLP